MPLSASTSLVQVVGAIAYGEWKAYDGARAQATATTDEEARRELRTIAAEELRHHKGFIRILERWGADPERAMRPYRAALDTYHGTEAGSELEEAVWDYIGEGIADDLLTWLRTVVDDAEVVEFIDGVIADEEHHEARATRELRLLLDATPDGRRRAARAARRMALRMLRSGGASALPMLAFLRIGRQPQLLATLLSGADRRLRAVGVGPLELALAA